MDPLRHSIPTISLKETWSPVWRPCMRLSRVVTTPGLAWNDNNIIQQWEKFEIKYKLIVFLIHYQKINLYCTLLLLTLYCYCYYCCCCYYYYSYCYYCCCCCYYYYYCHCCYCYCYCTLLYYYCTYVLYCTVLYCYSTATATVLYCTATVLYCTATVLCCAVICCCAVPCSAVQCCAVQCRAVPCRAVPCRLVLCFAAHLCDTPNKTSLGLLSCGIQHLKFSSEITKCPTEHSINPCTDELQRNIKQKSVQI